MTNLFLKDEAVETSPPIVGYRIMQLLEQKDCGRISLFELSAKYKNEKWFTAKNLYFGMLFLFSIGVIEFRQPYIVKNAENQ